MKKQQQFKNSDIGRGSTYHVLIFPSLTFSSHFKKIHTFAQTVRGYCTVTDTLSLKNIHKKNVSVSTRHCSRQVHILIAFGQSEPKMNNYVRVKENVDL